MANLLSPTYLTKKQGYKTDNLIVLTGVDLFNIIHDFNTLNSGGGSSSYLSYTALLTQSGTDAPTAIELVNSIGNIIWTRHTTGSYFGTLTDTFPENKCIFSAPAINWDGAIDSESFAYLSRASNDTITLYVMDDTHTNTDNFVNLCIEFKIYK